jgi:hypothetical protein
MPRFVLLRHECPPDFGPPSHWDLMLEDGAALATWRLAELPAPGGPAVAAERLADHRLAYLDYEGPLAGNRGSVHRVDAGEFQWQERTGTHIRVCLSGLRLKGLVELTLSSNTAWRLQITQ